MSYADQRAAYAWTDASKPGLLAWVLIICGEVVGAVSPLRNHPDSQLLAPLLLGIMGLSFACGLLVLLTRFEISLEDSGLSWRRSSLLNRMLKRPSEKRWISRQSITTFRLDKNPWTEINLTMVLDDGSSFRVRGRAAYA